MTARAKFWFVGLLVLLAGVGRWASTPEAQTAIANNASEISGKIVMLADGATNRTVTNLFTFSRNPNPPFAVSSGSAKVTNLDADLLDGLTSGRFAWTVVTTTSTGTQNNFNPGINADGGPTHVRCNNASLLTISGFPAGIDGQLILLTTVGAGQVNTKHNDSGSSAGNRLYNWVTTADTPIFGNATVVGNMLYIYDSSSAVWRLIAHNQGSWITPTFNAGNYTANGSMTWTVDSGDVVTDRYLVSGRTVYFSFYLNSTTIGGTVNTSLLLNAGLWGGYTVASQNLALDLYSDAGAANTQGLMQTSAGGTQVSLLKNSAANWTLGTNNTAIYGELFFEVQ